MISSNGQALSEILRRGELLHLESGLRSCGIKNCVQLSALSTSTIHAVFRDQDDQNRLVILVRVLQRELRRTQNIVEVKQSMTSGDNAAMTSGEPPVNVQRLSSTSRSTAATSTLLPAADQRTIDLLNQPHCTDHVTGSVRRRAAADSVNSESTQLRRTVLRAMPTNTGSQRPSTDFRCTSGVIVTSSDVEREVDHHQVVDEGECKLSIASRPDQGRQRPDQSREMTAGNSLEWKRSIDIGVESLQPKEDQIVPLTKANERATSNHKVYHADGYDYGVPRNKHRVTSRVHSVRSSPRSTSTVSCFSANRSGDRIKVFARKRPRTMNEIRNNDADVVTVHGRRSICVEEVKTALDSKKFKQQHLLMFDEVFDESSDNAEIYSTSLQPIVTNLFQHGSAVCFAFGQTGAGKTHTLLGTASHRGLYGLAASDLFQMIEQRNEPLTMSVTYYEIYRNRLYDLLNQKNRLRVREDRNHVVCVSDLVELQIDDVDSLNKVIREGNKNRCIGSTGANPVSSRSHALLQLQVRDSRKNTVVRLMFVDLAGGERATDCVNTDKKTKVEAAEINLDLLALKECIRSIDKSSPHTPYRQCKLTLLLRDSLVGRSPTVMIANVAPTRSACQHTLNTLRYADRVQELKKSDARLAMIRSLAVVCQGNSLASSPRSIGSSFSLKSSLSPRSFHSDFDCRPYPSPARKLQTVSTMTTTTAKKRFVADEPRSSRSIGSLDSSRCRQGSHDQPTRGGTLTVPNSRPQTYTGRSSAAGNSNVRVTSPRSHSRFPPTRANGGGRRGEVMAAERTKSSPVNLSVSPVVGRDDVSRRDLELPPGQSSKRSARDSPRGDVDARLRLRQSGAVPTLSGGVDRTTPMMLHNASGCRIKTPALSQGGELVTITAPCTVSGSLPGPVNQSTRDSVVSRGAATCVCSTSIGVSDSRADDKRHQSSTLAPAVRRRSPPPVANQALFNQGKSFTRVPSVGRSNTSPATKRSRPETTGDDERWRGTSTATMSGSGKVVWNTDVTRRQRAASNYHAMPQVRAQESITPEMFIDLSNKVAELTSRQEKLERESQISIPVVSPAAEARVVVDDMSPEVAVITAKRTTSAPVVVSQVTSRIDVSVQVGPSKIGDFKHCSKGNPFSSTIIDTRTTLNEIVSKSTENHQQDGRRTNQTALQAPFPDSKCKLDTAKLPATTMSSYEYVRPPTSDIVGLSTTGVGQDDRRTNMTALRTSVPDNKCKLDTAKLPATNSGHEYVITSTSDKISSPMAEVAQAGRRTDRTANQINSAVPDIESMLGMDEISAAKPSHVRISETLTTFTFEDDGAFDDEGADSSNIIRRIPKLHLDDVTADELTKPNAFCLTRISVGKPVHAVRGSSSLVDVPLRSSDVVTLDMSTSTRRHADDDAASIETSSSNNVSDVDSFPASSSRPGSNPDIDSNFGGRRRSDSGCRTQQHSTAADRDRCRARSRNDAEDERDVLCHPRYGLRSPTADDRHDSRRRSPWAPQSSQGAPQPSQSAPQPSQVATGRSGGANGVCSLVRTSHSNARSNKSSASRESLSESTASKSATAAAKTSGRRDAVDRRRFIVSGTNAIGDHNR